MLGKGLTQEKQLANRLVPPAMWLEFGAARSPVT